MCANNIIFLLVYIKVDDVFSFSEIPDCLLLNSFWLILLPAQMALAAMA